MAFVEKVERNQKIYREKDVEGKTYRQLSIKYDLAINTLVNIVMRERRKNGKE